MAWRRFCLVPFTAAALAGCHSPGLYGHARIYAPEAGEIEAVDHAREYDPVMASRFPQEWRAHPVRLFGIVTRRTDRAPGSLDALVSVRVLAPRNLCEADDEETCRVTVSDHERGKIHVLLSKLRTGDDAGAISIGVGSLLRVVGYLDPGSDANDATPVLEATYYRHWPRGYYVTTAESSVMRR